MGDKNMFIQKILKIFHERLKMAIGVVMANPVTGYGPDMLLGIEVRASRGKEDDLQTRRFGQYTVTSPKCQGDRSMRSKRGWG